MIKNIAYTTQVYFDRNPSGLILNLFSADLSIIDLSLIFSIATTYNQTFEMIILLLIMGYINFIIGILGILLFILLSFYISYFRKPLEKIKAFINISRSPVYSHINNTFTGLISIRAY